MQDKTDTTLFKDQQRENKKREVKTRAYTRMLNIQCSIFNAQGKTPLHFIEN